MNFFRTLLTRLFAYVSILSEQTRILVKKALTRLYNNMDVLFPQHLKLNVISHVNQFLTFFFLPSIYLVCKVIGLLLPYGVYLTLFSVISIYCWVFFDSRTLDYLCRFNHICINNGITQRFLYYALLLEQIVMTSLLLKSMCVFIGIGFVFMYLNGSFYDAILAYLIIWLSSLYMRFRFKYLNPIKLELIYGVNYAIPTWDLLVDHLNTCFLQEITQLRNNFHLRFQTNPLITSKYKRTNGTKFTFLANRSFATSHEIHRIGLEAFKVATKNATEGTALSLSILTLSGAIGLILYSQYNEHKLAKESAARADKKLELDEQRLALKQAKLELKKRKLQLLEDLKRQEDDAVKNKQQISDALGPFLSKKKIDNLDDESVKRLSKILSIEL